MLPSSQQRHVGQFGPPPSNTCINTIRILDSQDGPGLEVFLIHPFRLAYLQDLCVAQVLQATLELVQGIRLQSECSHDLLPHHLHYLQRRRGGKVRSSWMQEPYRMKKECKCVWRQSQYSQEIKTPVFRESGEAINFPSVPDRINFFFWHSSL